MVFVQDTDNFSDFVELLQNKRWSCSKMHGNDQPDCYKKKRATRFLSHPLLSNGSMVSISFGECSAYEVTHVIYDPMVFRGSLYISPQFPGSHEIS